MPKFAKLETRHVYETPCQDHPVSQSSSRSQGSQHWSLEMLDQGVSISNMTPVSCKDQKVQAKLKLADRQTDRQNGHT